MKVKDSERLEPAQAAIDLLEELKTQVETLSSLLESAMQELEAKKLELEKTKQEYTAFRKKVNELLKE